MATANSNINIAELDFDSIKSSLKSYLQNQSKFSDYNFEGSVLSTVLDLLAYNTHYNAFYLNMVANEMFLDTAQKRSSVISHAKLLNYTPKSCICASAKINLTFNGVTSPSLSLPRYTKFYSQAINNINYPFVILDTITTNSVNGVATFNGVNLYQGQPVAYNFVANLQTNPNNLFKLPDANIDLSTLSVKVYPNSQSSVFESFVLADSYLSLNGTNAVYFLQESLDGFYEIYFGDGVIGKSLDSSNLVVVEYLTTSNIAANGVGLFTLMDNIGGYTSLTINATQKAAGGQDKETIDNIKFHAPKSFSAQGRAVTKDDYITAIQLNKFGYSFDAVNVWGGQENNPPVYGQVFISIKPTGGYSLTDTQKQRLVDDVIKPISVMTVEPTLVEPDYTYIKLDVSVVYDPKKTTLTPTQIQEAIKAKIKTFSDSTLNKFNSTYRSSELNSVILNADNSIITNEVTLQLQKKIYPNLSAPTTYNLYFGVPLQKSLYSGGVSSSPSMKFRDKVTLSTIIDGVKIEEVPPYMVGADSMPVYTIGVASIALINPGYGYQAAPIVTIVGDGVGATAVATITAEGSIKDIKLTNSGTGYTTAIVKITPVDNDTTGQLGAAVAHLQGNKGTLRLYYDNTQQVKTIYSKSAGTVDYDAGIVTLDSFNPVEVDDPLGQLTVSVTPSTTIISSTFNRILTVDPFDPTAITVTVIPKTS